MGGTRRNLRLLRVPPTNSAYNGTGGRTIGLIRIEGQDSILMQNIEVAFRVPLSMGNGIISDFCLDPKRSQDRIFNIIDCTNVEFRDITVEGNYSGPDKSGYAFVLRNLYNVRFLNTNAQALWGVIGTDCINTIYVGATQETVGGKIVKNRSRLNRFDIHCYGRDVTIEDTDFIYECEGSSNHCNQVSSIFGYFSYRNCTFSELSPLRFEDSYYLYTFFNFRMTDCELIGVPEDRSLIKAGYVGIPDNMNECLRADLKMTSWPDVYITGLTLSDLPLSADSLILFNARKYAQNSLETNPIHGISVVHVCYGKAEDIGSVPPVKFSSLPEVRLMNEVSASYGVNVKMKT